MWFWHLILNSPMNMNRKSRKVSIICKNIIIWQKRKLKTMGVGQESYLINDIEIIVLRRKWVKIYTIQYNYKTNLFSFCLSLEQVPWILSLLTSLTHVPKSLPPWGGSFVHSEQTIWRSTENTQLQKKSESCIIGSTWSCPFLPYTLCRKVITFWFQGD